MPDSSKYDGTKTGRFVGLYSAICKIDHVNDGGTPAINGSWTVLPEEENFKCKRLTDSYERTLRSGTKVPEETLTGFEYASSFNQRDDDTFEFDASYAGSDCVLLVQGHYFKKLGTPLTQFLAIFGTVKLHNADVTSEDGHIGFTFVGKPNAQAVTLTGTPADGKITYPDVTGFTVPTADLTIPAYTGSVGVYKISDEATS
jgi:hypothetical protein